jgi:hypothetical protein
VVARLLEVLRGVFTAIDREAIVEAGGLKFVEGFGE